LSAGLICVSVDVAVDAELPWLALLLDAVAADDVPLEELPDALSPVTFGAVSQAATRKAIAVRVRSR
jgi:hypothetical protein